MEIVSYNALARPYIKYEVLVPERIGVWNYVMPYLGKREK